ncbi:MAG: NUDIX hydrolase [Candidatus Omnitrophica bacterium]|nr:NUDIX hydrolase [Candidatus Omnitrophota bacterium]
MNMCNKGLWFKVIAFILINSFLLLDVAWAGGGKISADKNTDTLAAQIQISQQQFNMNFDNLYGGQLGNTAVPVSEKYQQVIDNIYGLGQKLKPKDLQSKEYIARILSSFIEEKNWKPGSEEVDIIELKEGMEVVAGSLDAKLAHWLSFRHRTVNAFIVLPNGKIVLQRRAHHKRSEPLAMSIYGGHVKAGQSYEEAMREELREELELPKGQEIKGKLVRVREEGAFTWEKKNNVEVRSLYVYFATEDEVLAIMRNAEFLEAQKKKMSKSEFET